MRCPTCSELNSSGVRYCTNCGEDLFDTTKKPTEVKRESEEVVRTIEPDQRDIPTEQVQNEVIATPDEEVVTPMEQPDSYGMKNVSSSAQIFSTTLASRGSRLAAALLDSLYIFLAMMPGMVMMGIGSVTSSDALAGLGMLVSGGLAVVFAIFQFIILTNDGQTLGKNI